MPSDKNYVMPRPSLGLCLWRYSPTAQPSIALVTEVGQRTVSVTIFGEGNPRGTSRSGVHHISDPLLLTTHDLESGCWDFTDEQKRLAKILTVAK